MFNTLQYIAPFYEEYLWLVVLLSFWSLVWKGLALWKASRLSSRNWFVVLLIVNTVGILEILYIYFFSKKNKPILQTHNSHIKAHPGTINIDEFQKSQLRVAKVKSAKRVENSDKLLQLKVDLGSEERQIIAGIGTAYAPEELVNKEIVIIANLEPRKLMGLESQGMLLAASDLSADQAGGKPVILTPQREVTPGSKIQ